MSKKYSYDPACKVLAEHFLQDYPQFAIFTQDLAQEIQESVEDWFAYVEKKAKAGDSQ